MIIILIWITVNHDHQVGSSRVRPFNFTTVGLTLVIYLNVINREYNFRKWGTAFALSPYLNRNLKPSRINY